LRANKQGGFGVKELGVYLMLYKDDIYMTFSKRYFIRKDE